MNESITAIEKRAEEAHAEASAIIIRDQDSMSLANAKTIAIKGLIKEIDDTFKPIYDAQRSTAALTKETWDRFRVPLDGDYRRIKADIGAFLAEQDRIKREAELRAWQAEQAKIKAEAEARRVAEEALKKAAAAEAKGDNEKAEKILNAAAAKEDKINGQIEAAIVAAAAPIPARVQTVGISTREDWDIDLIDISQVPRDYLMFDEVKARKVVRASKGSIQIPGVKNVKKTIVSQR
jgi:hypothetical protein